MDFVIEFEEELDGIPRFLGGMGLLDAIGAHVAKRLDPAEAEKLSILGGAKIGFSLDFRKDKG
jgi:hypothetical protein